MCVGDRVEVYGTYLREWGQRGVVQEVTWDTDSLGYDYALYDVLLDNGTNNIFTDDELEVI